VLGPMRLGALLLRDGRITPAQLDAVVAQQARSGGRLGTILVELRLIDVDTLTVYLGLDLGIPIATRAALERAKRSAVRLLAPELAERFLVIPLIVQDRQLIAAMRDPHDLLALDELASATGYRVIPRVSPEVRLYYYLERYYGVPRPDRYKALGDVIHAQARHGADFVEAPPPPLPGLPPQVKHPIQPPAPPPLAHKPAFDVEENDELATELAAAASSAAPVAEPRPAPSSHDAATATSSRTSTAHASADSTGELIHAARTVAGAPQPITTEEILDLEPAVRRMSDATARSEVADAIIAHARGLFDVAVLLVVRDELAFGWKGFGRGLELERIDLLLIPLGVSSMFRMAAETSEPFVGVPPPGPVHSHMFKVLRTSAPRQAVVVPIAIKDRVVNLLYGHLEGDAQVTDERLAGLRRVAEAAANAYKRLIALQKQAG
jgi:hypothetical protein